MTDYKNLKPRQSSLIPALQAIAATAIIIALFGFVAMLVPVAIDKELDNRSAQAAASRGVGHD